MSNELTSDGGLDQLDAAIEESKAEAPAPLAVAYAALRGMYRVQIANGDGSLAGDSGWHKNQIVNLGVNDYLAQLMGDMAGSKQITHVALGTGTEPGAAATSLNGELDETSSRAGVTAATSSNSMKLRLTATFASQSSFVSTTMSIKNIGLFHQSNVTAGTIFAGNTYATSTVATNQNVNVTYDVDFSTS